MKRLYIKPETERIVCQLVSMLAESKPKTDYEIGTGGNDQPIIPGDEPNPEGNAKRVDVWDDWEE